MDEMEEIREICEEIPHTPLNFREITIGNAMHTVTLRSTFDKETIEYLSGKALFMLFLCENDELKEAWLRDIKKDMLKKPGDKGKDVQ